MGMGDLSGTAHRSVVEELKTDLHDSRKLGPKVADKRSTLLLPPSRQRVVELQTTPLVTTALRMGLLRRDRAGYPAQNGLVHHSDAASQFSSVSYAGTLALEGTAASIGSIGDAYNHVLAESTIGRFKNEAIRAGSPFRSGPLRTIDDVEWVSAGWVDWYNARRLNPPLGTSRPMSSRPRTTLTSKRHPNR